MPRDGSGTYSLPPATEAVSNDPISSAKYNTLTRDLEADANAVRPIVAGGTGGNTAAAARTALGLGTAAEGDAADYAKVANNLSDLADAPTARTNLGLGTAAVKGDSDFVEQVGSVLIGGMGGMIHPDAALQDWNLPEHMISGFSPYIMNGLWANGFGVNAYYNVENRSYNNRDGSGRVMQLATPMEDYGTDKEKNALWFRHKDIAGTWTAWHRILTDLDPIDPAQGEVGDIAFAAFTGTMPLVYGSIVAGSDLSPAIITSTGNGSTAYTVWDAATTLSGTWRALGGHPTSAPGGAIAMFKKVS